VHIIPVTIIYGQSFSQRTAGTWRMYSVLSLMRCCLRPYIADFVLSA
jgi:hypothetical protein